jgi:hypothetical protein
MNKAVLALALAFLLSLPFAAFAGSRKPAFRKVIMERTPCFGACPIYKVKLTNDGTLTYTGIRFVKRIGTFTTKISPDEVDKVFQTLDRVDFWKLKDNYSRTATDLPGTNVTVVVGERAKVIKDYGNCGPLELWIVERVLDGLVNAHEDWKKE